MFINKDSVKVNNISFGKYLVGCEVQFNKLWGKDTGRTMSGKYVGSLLGIYPKIVMNFAPLSRADLNIVQPILDSPTQTITYYDSSKNKNITMKTYTGDYTIKDRGINKTEGFNCSFIAIDKRPK